jgi:uncharacterized protein (TIGR00255 family)
MTIYSMTGYASVQQHGDTADTETAPTDTAQLVLEIRSVNSRFLDLSFKLPEELRQHEPALRQCLQAKLKRGKVELRATLESGVSRQAAKPTAALLQRLSSIQDNVRSWLPQAQALSVADVVRLCANEPSNDPHWPGDLLQLADQAVQALLAARQREGTRLAAALLDRIGQLRALVAQAEPLIPQLVTQQRERFLARWKEAMALHENTTSADVAQERALAEATAFAMRVDIAEELTRLNAHLDEIERLLHKGGEIGKRLDFLTQELHREANTLSAKSAALALTRLSVDMRVLIEQIREQVQNLE